MGAQLIPPKFYNYGFDGTLWIPMLVDELTGSTSGIDLPHLETHHGDRYTVIDHSTVATSSVRDILLKVGTKYPHLTFPYKVIVTTEALVELYEGTTVSADGTAITPLNLNRDSTNTSDVDVFHTPTITADGTQLFEIGIGTSGTTPAKEDFGGSAGGDRNEMILKVSTNYLIRVTNEDTSDSLELTIEANWYEL